jgi:hypothetical protein
MCNCYHSCDVPRHINKSKFYNICVYVWNVCIYELYVCMDVRMCVHNAGIETSMNTHLKIRGKVKVVNLPRKCCRRNDIEDTILQSFCLLNFRCLLSSDMTVTV